MEGRMDGLKAGLSNCVEGGMRNKSEGECHS